MAIQEFTRHDGRGRYGSVDEFSKVAAFLVSDCAGYVTGGSIRVDGGYIRST